MNTAAYLARIGDTGPLHPTAATLRRLHRAHLLAVPFENLDIHRCKPLVLDEAALCEKIVARRRGGFCYELNGLFATLLRRLGFQVEMLSAAAAKSGGGFGPEFDHMTLLVELEERWLADVGFGDFIQEPLLLDERAEQVQGGWAYRIVPHGEGWSVEQREPGGNWVAEYRFGSTPHVFADSLPMCRHHQTSLESPFTQGRICSLATRDGRVTLRDRRLIETVRGERRERELENEEQVALVLRERFGIDLA